MLEAILDTARQLRKSRKLPQPRLYRKPKNVSLFTNFLKKGGERQGGVKENVVTPSVWSARPAELAAKEIRKGSAEEIR
jgi:hypothetical protein